MRPVINLMHLSHFVHTPHFKMECIHTVKEHLQPNDWLTKNRFERRLPYFTIPTSGIYQKFLRFTVGNQNYQFTCLPFSLSSIPRVFTKTLKPVAAMLRKLRLVLYLGDILIMADIPRVALDRTCLLTLFVGESWLSGTSREVIYHPATECRIFGHDSRFLNNGTDSSRGKDEEDQNGIKESQGLISLDLMRAILPNREDDINGTGQTPWLLCIITAFSKTCLEP